MLALVLSAVLATQAQETITVQRVLVDVRVTNDRGEPVTDLAPADFAVRIAGKPAVVESAEFVRDVVGSQLSEIQREESPTTANRQPTTAGRTIVLFVQTDFARHNTRTHGQLNFLRYADDMIRAFAPEDRIAVFSFDSHLKFRLDLTGDKEQVVAALTDSISIDHPPPPPAVPEPSLAPHLSRDAMRRAAHAETALLLVAHALRQVPGTKSLLLLGWGRSAATTSSRCAHRNRCRAMRTRSTCASSAAARACSRRCPSPSDKARARCLHNFLCRRF
jgi:VWFA-related protein